MPHPADGRHDHHPSGVTDCATPARHSSSAGTATVHVKEPATLRAGVDARFPPTVPPDTAPAVVSYADLLPSPPEDHQLSADEGTGGRRGPPCGADHAAGPRNLGIHP
ncbi:hypothetical protein [Streptomyces olivaceoviridis]|uniref:hypothetical protein n=1 Tax=Streptomyces olivaceoviridis TaxID=1921 RepID=UPI0036F601AB